MGNGLILRHLEPTCVSQELGKMGHLFHRVFTSQWSETEKLVQCCDDQQLATGRTLLLGSTSHPITLHQWAVLAVEQTFKSSGITLHPCREGANAITEAKRWSNTQSAQRYKAIKATPCRGKEDVADRHLQPRVVIWIKYSCTRLIGIQCKKSCELQLNEATSTYKQPCLKINTYQSIQAITQIKKSASLHREYEVIRSLSR